MDPRFPPTFYGPHASRLGHKGREKNSVHNLQYGPRTRLIRGINTHRKLCIFDTVSTHVHVVVLEFKDALFF